MATHSVNDLTSLINTQINSHEKIQGYLLKAEALVQVALGVDFLESKRSHINEYLGILHEIIIESKYLHECALSDLMKKSKLSYF